VADVQVLVEGRPIDIFQFDFSFNYAIADIRHPDERKTEYSKTIQCPGTQRNDAIFGQIYDVNISNAYNASAANIAANFNPNKRANARIITDGIEVMDGTLQLRQITAKKDQLIYEVIFIGKTANIFNELGDAELNGLDDDGNPLIDFSDLDHEYNYGEIVNSWSNTDGYVYPMLDYGVNEPSYLQTTERIYRVNDFRPAVFLHDIVDRIFSFADFSYTSIFLSSAFFRKLIIPWTNEGFQLSESEVAARTALAISPGQSLRTAFAPNYPNPGFNQNVLLNFDSNIDPFDLWNDAGDYYQAPSDGWFNVTSVPSFTVERVSAPSGSNPVVTGQFNAVLNVYVQRVSGAVQLQQSFIVTIDIPASPTIGATATTLVSTFSENIFMEIGDRVYMEMSVEPNVALFLFDQCELTLDNTSTIEVTSGELGIVEGQIIPMNSLVPEVEMKDLLLSIIQMFNLYIGIDPNDERNLLIETRDTFYASGRVKDWTHKMARDKDVTLQPLGLLTGNEFVYTYAEDDDLYNKKYKDSYGHVYGRAKAEVDNDFQLGTNEMEVVFSATPMVNDNPSNRIIGKIYNEDLEDGVAETEHNIRLLYYGGLIPSNPDWIFRYRQATQNGFVNIDVAQSSYPYAGHLTHPGTGGIIPQQDINFGIPRQLFYSGNAYTGTLLYTNANLFNVFHRNHVIEITNKDSKLMTAMFYLEPLDIMNLDFRDQIQIDNSYWRINEIKDYNPFKEQLTKVELFKVIVKEPLEVDTFQVGQPKKVADGLAKVNAPVVKKVQRSGNVFPQFNGGKVSGKRNRVGDSTTTFMVQGNDNFIGEGSSNITIIGDRNEVGAGLHNVRIIGTDGAKVLESNVTIINGEEQMNGYIIEGGEDEVRATDAGGTIYVVDGMEDEVQEQYGESAIYVVDGGQNIN
jgi:hypothetical protein